VDCPPLSCPQCAYIACSRAAAASCTVIDDANTARVNFFTDLHVAASAAAAVHLPRCSGAAPAS
jgi:hypothetical protein